MMLCQICDGSGRRLLRKCNDCNGLGFIMNDESFVEAKAGDATRALKILNKLSTWYEYGWEYIIRNEKEGKIGHFVQLGVLPYGCEGVKFVSAQGVDLLDAMEMAEIRGKEKMIEWERSEISLDKLYKTENNESTQETENGQSTVAGRSGNSCEAETKCV